MLYEAVQQIKNRKKPRQQPGKVERTEAIEVEWREREQKG